MAEKQRWIAMYTKHLKQKRKVYHDGFLDLHIARKKVFLHSSLPILRIKSTRLSGFWWLILHSLLGIQPSSSDSKDLGQIIWLSFIGETRFFLFNFVEKFMNYRLFPVPWLNFDLVLVMLYDEDDNLLESRTLKACEVVNTGETLTFQAYLVDICDPKDGSKASSEPKVEPSDQKCARKPFTVLRPNFKKSSLRCDEKKPDLVNKFSSKSLSPSHNMIRGEL
ncbi:hypothetical protein AtEden1_Chr4g0285041 [Arabidopsis thaliana]